MEVDMVTKFILFAVRYIFCYIRLLELQDVALKQRLSWSKNSIIISYESKLHLSGKIRTENCVRMLCYANVHITARVPPLRTPLDKLRDKNIG